MEKSELKHLLIDNLYNIEFSYANLVEIQKVILNNIDAYFEDKVIYYNNKSASNLCYSFNFNEKKDTWIALEKWKHRNSGKYQISFYLSGTVSPELEFWISHLVNVNNSTFGFYVDISTNNFPQAKRNKAEQVSKEIVKALKKLKNENQTDIDTDENIYVPIILTTEDLKELCEKNKNINISIEALDKAFDNLIECINITDKLYSKI